MDSLTCPTCGAPVDAEEARGFCPACLLLQGIKPADPDPLRSALQAKLGREYRLVRLLGRGGMGSVYLARDLTLDREVAIKVVRTDSSSRDVHERLRREAKTAARLTHPNIVPLHAFGEVEGLPYVVMGYVRGETLAARLRRDGRVPEHEARRVMAEIADALDHAHRQGVVHRDVKPDNVLLDDETGRAMLTDFGVAKALGSGETVAGAGMVVGTPHYMSPEQAAGRADIDGRSDVYALGVMGYAMLAGRVPFDGPTAGDVLRKHLTQEAPPLASLVTDLAASTLEVIERCLAKDPARRWPDARSVHRALGVVDETRLPDGLQAVEGRGFVASIIALAFMGLLVVTGAPVAVKLFNAAIVAGLYVYAVAHVRREGFSIPQVQHAIWTEPTWWMWWYPRPLRRRGNVWNRLPPSVRRLRAWLPAFVAYVAAFTATFIVLNVFVYPPHIPGPLQLSMFVVTALGMIGLEALHVALRSRAHRDLRDLGLAPREIDLVATTMPLSRVDFWARPHIAEVLAPDTPVAAPRPDAPHDLLQAILRDGAELSGPLRPLGAQAAAAARRLLATIADADQEMVELSRSVEPGEDARLAERIRVLGGAEDAAPLRLLLERQLEVIGDLQSRLAAANGRRNRRLELLRTLALHVSSLRARAAAPASVGSLSEDVQALCEEISRQALGPGASMGSSLETPTRTFGGDGAAPGRDRIT